MLCVLCLIVLWGFSLVTSYSGVKEYCTNLLIPIHNFVCVVVAHPRALGCLLGPKTTYTPGMKIIPLKGSTVFSPKDEGASHGSSCIFLCGVCPAQHS